MIFNIYIDKTGYQLEPIAEKLNWLALICPPAWLLANKLFLSTGFYFLYLAIIFYFILSPLLILPLVVPLVAPALVLPNLYFWLEGSQYKCFALKLFGYRLADIVAADNSENACLKFLLESKK